MPSSYSNFTNSGRSVGPEPSDQPGQSGSSESTGSPGLAGSSAFSESLGSSISSGAFGLIGSSRSPELSGSNGSSESSGSSGSFGPLVPSGPSRPCGPIGPPAPSSPSGTSNYAISNENNLNLNYMFSNFLESMNLDRLDDRRISTKPKYDEACAALSPSSLANNPYNMWAEPSTPQQNPIGPICREYHHAKVTTFNQVKITEVDSSISSGIACMSLTCSTASPGTACMSLTCNRCHKQPPQYRCYHCNDLYCYGCCHIPTCICQRAQHSLLPIDRISPIATRHNSISQDNEMTDCDYHKKRNTYYCISCVKLICTDCLKWAHRDHKNKFISDSRELVDSKILNTIEQTKVGCKDIKSAMDRMITLTKSCEKEFSDASANVKNAMRAFIQAAEDREKFLLQRITKIHQSKTAKIESQSSALRGLLSGLSHTHDYLVNCINFEGVNLVQANRHAVLEITEYANSFRLMDIEEEKIVVDPPNYDLVEKLKQQCEVKIHSSPKQPLAPSPQNIHNQQPVHNYPKVQYKSTTAATWRAQSDYNDAVAILPVPAIAPAPVSVSVPAPAPTPASSSSDNFPVERGAGQAIAGLSSLVVAKKLRSNIPGVPMFSFAREGQDRGQVSRPWGLCIDKDGNIIVADRRNNRIQIFSKRGEFKQMFGCKGNGNGEFDLPAGITTDSLSRIIVVDKDNHRVQIFTRQGQFLQTFGTLGKESGQFQYPWDVAVNSLNHIVVTDTRNHRIQLFNSGGVFITKFAFDSPSPARGLKGPTTPRGVCFTKFGDVAISDFENHRMIIVDANFSQVLHCYGCEHPDSGELNRPSGIVSDDEGRLLVADSKNHRLLAFSTDLRLSTIIDLRSPGLDDKDRPSDVALSPEGYITVLFETLPDSSRDSVPHSKQYIKVY